MTAPTPPTPRPLTAIDCSPPAPVQATGRADRAHRGRSSVERARRTPPAAAPNVDDAVWIEWARRGDADALGVLYQRFSPEIYRYLRRRVGDGDLAADLTAQVFVQVIEAIAAGRTWHHTFEGWLHRIARNLLIDHIRVVRRRPQCTLSDANLVSPRNGVDREVGRPLVAHEVRAAMGELKPDQAAILHLRFAEGLTHADVARQFGKSEVAVKVSQHRALRALRARLEGRGALAASGPGQAACRSGRTRTDAVMNVERPMLNGLPAEA